MFIGTELPDPLKAGLTEFSKEHKEGEKNLPIRVLAGRFRPIQPGAWTSEQAKACNVSKAHAEKHGLTIVDWGSASQQYPREWENLTGLVYEDSDPRKLQVRDVIVPQDGSTRSALPYEVGGVEDHFELGEIGERTVWYFINLQHVPSPDKLELDTFLFEPCRRAIDPELMVKFREEMEERSAKAFAELMTNNPKQRYERQQARIVEMEGQLRTFEQQMTSTNNNLVLASKELDAILAVSQTDPEHWKNQWRRIAGHPLILPNTLQMSEMKVMYDTKELMLHHPTDDREVVLGSMRVTLDMHHRAVHIENLTNRRRNRDHPHVENGNPCWGGYQSEINKYLEDNQIAGVVEFLFGYLQTYNPQDDWGRFAQYWFENPATPAEGGAEVTTAVTAA